jgi:hypothetical protein
MRRHSTCSPETFASWAGKRAASSSGSLLWYGLRSASIEKLRNGTDKLHRCERLDQKQTIWNAVYTQQTERTAHKIYHTRNEARQMCSTTSSGSITSSDVTRRSDTSALLSSNGSWD